MVHLRDLKFNHLDHQKNKPFSIVSGGIAERSVRNYIAIIIATT